MTSPTSPSTRRSARLSATKQTGVAPTKVVKTTKKVPQTKPWSLGVGAVSDNPFKKAEETKEVLDAIYYGPLPAIGGPPPKHSIERYTFGTPEVDGRTQRQRSGVDLKDYLNELESYTPDKAWYDYLLDSSAEEKQDVFWPVKKVPELKIYNTEKLYEHMPELLEGKYNTAATVDILGYLPLSFYKEYKLSSIHRGNLERAESLLDIVRAPFNNTAMGLLKQSIRSGHASRATLQELRSVFYHANVMIERVLRRVERAADEEMEKKNQVRILKEFKERAAGLGK